MIIQNGLPIPYRFGPVATFTSSFGEADGFFDVGDVCHPAFRTVSGFKWQVRDGETCVGRTVPFLKCFEGRHSIQPFQPLPAFPNRYDLVRATLPAFNGTLENPWTDREWRYFVEDVRKIYLISATILS